jgi:predicted RND superfamily exporter protein
MRASPSSYPATTSTSRPSSSTDDLFFLPGVDRRTVTSLWTPNTRYFEITEEGMEADDVVPSHVLPDSMSAEDIALIRNRVVRGGYVGRLVAKDHSAAMVTAELLEVDPKTEERLDYLALGGEIEREIRQKHESEAFDVHILGFVKLIGDIADGAKSVVRFFVLAFVLTVASVYYYARSWILTILPLFCSLVSVVWQFGAIQLLGFGLDPLAILVPFLVFAIGVSHGVQQINLIAREVCRGADSMTAARRSFSGLLVPGTMALVTDLIGFGTLMLIPIGMIEELGITALIGVGFKIVTNLVLLPVLVSYFRFDGGYVARESRARETREWLVGHLGTLAEPRHAVVGLFLFTVLLGAAVWQSQGRHVGDLHAGVPELHPESRYNVDASAVASRFSLGLDVLTVIAETPAESCIDYATMEYIDRFSWHMRNVPGVLSVISAPVVAKQVNAGWSEGNLKWMQPLLAGARRRPAPGGHGAPERRVHADARVRLHDGSSCRDHQDRRGSRRGVPGAGAAGRGPVAARQWQRGDPGGHQRGARALRAADAALRLRCHHHARLCDVP